MTSSKLTSSVLRKIESNYSVLCRDSNKCCNFSPSHFGLHAVAAFELPAIHKDVQVAALVFQILEFAFYLCLFALNVPFLGDQALLVPA